jgi:hypothetical protein
MDQYRATLCGSSLLSSVRELIAEGAMTEEDSLVILAEFDKVGFHATCTSAKFIHSTNQAAASPSSLLPIGDVHIDILGI